MVLVFVCGSLTPFANDRFLVVASNIMPDDAIVVKAVQDRQATLISFSVVWLSSSCPSLKRGVISMLYLLVSQLLVSYLCY